VTRDDLSDGGSQHFAEVIRAIKKHSPQTAIEVLIPDFKGNLDSLKSVADALPTVISHNMETVRSLYDDVRPEAEYKRSLNLIKNIKLLHHNIHSKSGIMVGLGETKEQVYELFDDLREAGCEFLTIGQYLAPTKEHFPIKEYIEPSQFDEYGKVAREKGFTFVASAPLVRSSYHAGEALNATEAMLID
jgi:lipoic acid synthetase